MNNEKQMLRKLKEESVNKVKKWN